MTPAGPFFRCFMQMSWQCSRRGFSRLARKRAGMTHDVFICYSYRDKPVADAVCAVLESEGVRCWIAPRDILPGADWGECIIDAINDARAMVLIFSGNANEAQSQIK